VSVSENPAAVTVEVFWRPGCPYCSSLRKDLARRGIDATWRNIWQDDQARSQVRAANQGNETVPTVRIGTEILTNPSGARIAQLTGRSADTPTRTGSGRMSGRWLLSWLPILALIVLSELLARSGHGGVSWVVDALAVAAWWFTRPLRR
jgi:mycoredoxin